MAMILKKHTMALLAVSTLAVAACETTDKLEKAQYWQRKNASSALYLTGPKAQQTLHMDIATCVNEMSELERMDALREAIPADTKDGMVPDPNTASGSLKKWDTPKRDGALYAEHFDYTDFEGCMTAKGWERVDHLPYEREKTANQDYLETIYGEKYQSEHPDTKPANADGYATSSPGTVVNN